MKRKSIFLCMLLLAATTVFSGTSVTITLTATGAMDSTTVINAALSAAGTTRNAVTEIKLESVSDNVYWNLKDCRVVSIYFRPAEAPALTALDLSATPFQNKMTPHSSTTGSGAFLGMGITHLVLPADLDTLGGRSFMDCKKLTDITWPTNLRAIKEAAFSKCSVLALTSLPESITKIDAYAFQSSSELALTVLPPELNGIIGGNLERKSTFQNTKISISELPAGVTGIGANTFQGCPNITSMTFPKGFTAGIGAQAFDKGTSASNLTKLIFKGSTPPASIAENAFGSNASKIDVIVPVGALSAYQTALGGFGFKSITEASSTALSRTDISEEVLLSPTVATKEIRLSGLEKTQTIHIYDVMGEEVLTFNTAGKQDQIISVDRLIPGIYLLKARNADLKFIKK